MLLKSETELQHSTVAACVRYSVGRHALPNPCVSGQPSQDVAEALGGGAIFSTPEHGSARISGGRYRTLYLLLPAEALAVRALCSLSFERCFLHLDSCALYLIPCILPP